MNWTSVFEVIIGVWVATVATLALKTWKQQSKAQIQMDFMDEITDAVHEFIQLMSAPITMIKFIKINIEAYSGRHDLPPEIQNPEIITYIQKNGKEDQKKLSEYLEPCRSVLSKIRSLTAKGQVLHLINYSDCYNACSTIGWQFDRIEAVSYMIGNVTLNWEHPEVQKTLSKVMDIDSKSIEENMGEQNTLFLTFVKENYQAIFN